MASKHDVTMLREFRLLLEARNAGQRNEGREYIRTADTKEVRESKQEKTPPGRMGKAAVMTRNVRASTEEDQDRFSGHYSDMGLLEPPYPFADLWRIYEESDVIMLCIQSIVDNAERQHDFTFLGDDKEKKLPENQANRTELFDFFRRVNENESMVTLRRKLRKDWLVTANAFCEVIRNLEMKPEFLYYIPSTHMRTTAMDDKPYLITVNMPRAGKLIPQEVPVRFRRFCRYANGMAEPVWFKQMGDPRLVDKRTGAYVLDADKNFILDADKPDYEYRATEIWWTRDNWAGNAYGIPKWVSCLWDTRGRYLAKWINFDHLESGAIPPGVFVPTGGRLSNNSMEAFKLWKASLRDPHAYNEIPIIEIEPDLSFDLNRGATASQTKLEYLRLRDAKDEDFMFAKYLADTEAAIRKIFRLPPLYTGSVAEYSNATSYAAMEIAEVQIFEPMRAAFDEEITTKFIQNEFGIYNWQFRTKQPRINDKEVFYRAVRIWGTVGGPSINQLIELGNEVFGTEWSLLEGELYNEPAAIVMSLTGQGLTTYLPDPANAERLIFQMKPPEQVAAIKLDNEWMETVKADVQEMLGKIRAQLPGDYAAVKREEDAKALFDILDRIEQRGYEPTEITEEDLAV